MNICVFCGSSKGMDSSFATASNQLGSLIGSSNHTLVYGGGNVGLMGNVADATLAAGGKVVGVIPDFLLRREVAHRGLTQLEVVESMHERKKRMADLSDAFIAMPGGWGTLDELAEILTWKQLGLINQPIGVLNTEHFFDPLLNQMRVMVAKGFLPEVSYQSIKIAESPQELLIQLDAFSVQRD